MALSSGQELARVTELSCGGVVPLGLGRVYNPVDSFNNKAGTTGSLGFGWTLNYDIALLPFQGPQKRILVPGGSWVNFTDQGGGIYKNTDDRRFDGATMLATNATAHEWEVHFKDGRLWRFRPFPGITGVIRGGPPLFLTEIVDSSGNSLFITRATNGHIMAVGTAQRSMKMTYGANNFISKVEDPIGRIVEFTYNTDDRLATVKDASGTITRYTYVGDSEFPESAVCPIPTTGLRIKTIEYPGRTTLTENHHGPSRRILRQTSYLGEYKFAYKLIGACVTNVNTPGVKQTGLSVPDTDSWENYQAGWRIIGGQIIATTVTDPRGQTRTQIFNAKGSPLESQDSLGNKVTRKYDANNRVIQITDALGRVTRYGYDEKGNMVHTVDPDNRLTEWDYDPKWNKVTEVRRSLDASTKVTLQRMTYHPATGKLVTSTDANNRTTSYAYTAKGQIETITDARGKVTKLSYSPQGDLIAITDPLGNTRRMTTDNAGRTIEVTDATGFSTEFALNARDQQELITEPTQAKVKLEYDARGNLTKVTNQNNQVIETNTYTERDKLASRTDGAGKTETFTYDANGNVRTYTDKKNQTTTLTYDESNRPTRIDYADGRVETGTYDMPGRLATLSDAQGTISYQYDNLGRIAQASTAQGTIKYGYDVLDRRNRLETPQQTTTYTYDTEGLLKTIAQGSEVTTIDYDENGRRKSLTYPNGIVATYGYDDAGRLTSLVYQRGTTIIESLSYTYDANGNIINRVRSGAAAKQESAKEAQYDPLTNRLLSLNGEAFQYDDNGNMLSRTNSCGTTTYTWNVKNELTAISGFKSDCSPVTASFAYDVQGRRTQATINGDTTTYLYDGFDVIAEIGAKNAHYLRTDNIDEAIARYSSQSDRYFLTDLLGSTHVLTDRQGTATTTYNYSPFGETEVQGQASDNPAQYTQRENDGTGLYYYRARYYAPDIARFITSDPIGLAGGLNTYAYVQNNPLRWADPLGLLNGCVGPFCSGDVGGPPGTVSPTWPPGIQYEYPPKPPAEPGIPLPPCFPNCPPEPPCFPNCPPPEWPKPPRPMC